MIRFNGAILATVLLAGWAQSRLAPPVEAHPELLTQFQKDPLRLAGVDGCVTCHDNADGTGPRNDFGSAFDEAGQEITPLLRARFPDRFGFFSTKLADGSAFHFSDPDSKVAVFERAEKMFILDLEALSTDVAEVLPPPANRMTFFVTSAGPGNGGHLKGLAGADQHCQSLAEAVGAGDRTWRAYLSTSFAGRPAIHAGNRIGSGPWYNAKAFLVARGVADLHQENRLTKQSILTEKGEMVSGQGDEPNRHDILTGSLADGTAAVGMNCNNWTSAGEDTAMVGHHDREGGGENGGSWNAAHASRGCSQEDLRSSGGDGLFYCFAIQ